MNMLSNEQVSNELVSKERGLKWMVSNEWSQMNGLKWIGLNSHGTVYLILFLSFKVDQLIIVLFLLF